MSAVVLPSAAPARAVVLGLTSAEARRLLSGHDLACWCPLEQPRHADVLLELANR